MKIRVLLPLLIGSIMLNSTVQAQCMQVEVSLQQRVQSSSAIVEGEVLQSQATWDNSHEQIFTVHRVRVTKVFKGTVTSQFIEVATDGGIVGNTLQVVDPALKLEEGQRGVFLLDTKNDVSPQFGGSQVYLPVAAEQGFINYGSADEAIEPFHTYPDRTLDLYPVLTQLVGQPYQTVAPLTNNSGTNRASNRRSVAPVITAFGPSPITAGTFSELTINGNNFGTNTGSAKVEFANADNGGLGFVPANPLDIQSWSNTEIKVHVPTGAGTGKIRVTNNLGEAGQSSSNLTVTYDLVTLFVAGDIFRPRLANINGAGGYTFQMNVNFDNNPAVVSAVQRAFSTWRCGTGVNFELATAPTTKACNTNDGTNTLTWDTACALPGGVLGRSTSFYSACGNPLVFYLVDTDIRFSKNAAGLSWNFGPGNPAPFEIDFESVVLHETGHSHQLGHVIAMGKVMHYVLQTGTTARVLDVVSDVGGGLDVMSVSTTSSVCGPGAMVAVSPSACSGVPTASFGANPRSGCAPLQVSFIDQSLGGPTSWEWDFNNDGIVDDTTQNPIYVYTQVGTYSVKLKVSNSNGSDSLTQTNYIVVSMGPTAEAGANITTCAGKTFTLGGNPTASGGTGPYTYDWSPDGPLSSSTVPNPTGSTQTSTTFRVIVIDANGCSATDTIRVTITPGPTVDAGPVADVCDGSSKMVGGNPSATGGAGGYTYDWSPGIYFDDSTLANPMVMPTIPFVATLTVTDQAGCMGSDTVSIRILQNPRAEAGPNVVRCLGSGGVTIGGNPSATGGAGGYSYVWQPFVGLNNYNIANPVGSPSTSQIYTLLVTDALGCSDMDSMTFTVVPNPTANAGAMDTVCAGQAIQIGGSPTAMGGTAPYTYSWNPASGLNNPALANPMAMPVATTQYSVTVTDANGCTGTGSVIIQVLPSPAADAGPDISICGGTGPVTLEGNPTASGGTPGYSYLWTPAPGTGAQTSSYEVNPGTTTIYTVEVTDANGCVETDNATVFVSAGVVAVISGQDTICPGECTQLQGLPQSGTPPFSYSWSNGNTVNPITVCPLTTTTYTLTITDGAGCSHDTSITVVVLSAPSVSVSGLDTTYCENDAATTVTVSPTGGTLSGPGISGTDFDPGMAGVGTHTIYYELTGGNGCTGRDSIIVTVNASPPKPTVTRSHDTVFTAGGYAAYKWVFNGVGIANATDTFFHVTVVGNYAVEVTNADGCTTKSDDLFVDPTGIDLLKDIATVEVYPNPASNTVWVHIESDKPLEPTIRVVSVTGSVVWDQAEPLSREHLVAIPVDRLAAGLYMVEVRAEGRSRWQRLVVE